MKIKFAHVADCHLGAWRKDSLNRVGFEAFNKMIDILIEESVDFVIISGDLYDVSNPKVEVVDWATRELKRLYDAGIPVYGIMGSHDFSPSNKSMIRPLISAHLFQNVSESDYIDDKPLPLRLKFVEDPKSKIKLTGMRARKRGLELEDYEQLDVSCLEEEAGTKIFVLHTMIDELKPKEHEAMASGRKSILPRDFLYYAGGHLHDTLPKQLRDEPYTIKKDADVEQKVVYPGCLYPTNFRELEKIQHGGFCIVSGDSNDGELEVKYYPVQIKEVVRIYIDANNKSTLKVEELLDAEINHGKFDDKIVVVRIEGKLSSGKSHEIKVNKIIEKIKGRGAYEVFVNKAKLTSEEYANIHIDLGEDNEQIEGRLINEHVQNAKIKAIPQAKLEQKIHQLLNSIGRDLEEGEKVKDYDREMIDTFYNIFEINREGDDE
jgi:hypothetical protein